MLRGSLSPVTGGQGHCFKTPNAFPTWMVNFQVSQQSEDS